MINRIYFDYAASTPIDSEVLKAMEPYFGLSANGKFGNPSSLHSFGREAMAAVDKSREKVAKALGADFREIIFTGSATEANNLALRGVLKLYRRQSIKSVNQRPRIIISAIEHESIFETARDLESEGVEVVYLPVDKHGFVDLKKLENILNERTILVSVMYANNEIGTIQPISKISEIIRNFRNNLKIKIKNLESTIEYPLFHTDAVQAFQFLNCDVRKLGIDLMTLSAHKIYGPKGIGALFINSIKNSISSIITGGRQEFGLRSGTENVALIVGFAKAVELVFNNSRTKSVSRQKLEKKRIGQLRDYFWRELKKIYPKAEINGCQSFSINSQQMLPNILNIYFPNQLSQDLLIKFDLAGVAVSSGAACSSRTVKPSRVLQALGFSVERARSSIRFSLGRFTTKAEIIEGLKRIKNIL